MSNRWRGCAVVHHGGAGTTMTAARAGAPQVVVPAAKLLLDAVSQERPPVSA
jgi:hypothetical protein